MCVRGFKDMEQCLFGDDIIAAKAFFYLFLCNFNSLTKSVCSLPYVHGIVTTICRFRQQENS